ncbi:MAG TPA: 16S rRNA (guanine(966)-N(2))-methyltransferase RsmD [Bacteroidia bacterium]|nr:16S rRNA (guanine(966)-N(2))-methyltransferase RsmD [Bacteroidia bacterium]HNU34683.1 16S rRNA (guanine(966)-N(2))-methyltransferase RsmD [Bacteroidia bacterium]
MRIISGRFARKNITAPANLPVRPTTDFAKTGLFNILNNKINFKEVAALDLFAGTGNISYEFISRGADRITCVDQSQACTKFITQTFELLHANEALVIKQDVFSFLSETNKTYDLIFADPPFNFQHYTELVDTIFEKGILNKNGLLVLEHGGNINFSQNKFIIEERKYGAVHFSFFKN